MKKTSSLWLLAALVLLVSGCGGVRTPESPIEQIIENAPEESREAMRARVPLHRAILG